MAATGEEDVSALSERVDKLNVSTTDDQAVNKSVENGADSNARTICEPRLWGFETRELYKLALNFYKGEYLTVDFDSLLARFLGLHYYDDVVRCN